MAARSEKKRKGKRVGFSFFSRISPRKKSIMLKYSGLAVAVLAVLAFISSVSYLFTWQVDQSLMSHPEMMENGVEFLVSKCFGLGSFALIFLLGAVARRLYQWNRSIGLLRITFITVVGAFLSSLVLAYVSMLFGPDTCFGGGAGGYAGHAVVLGMSNLFGSIVTALLIIILVVAWMIVSNRRFACWFALCREPEPTDVELLRENRLGGDDIGDGEDMVPVTEPDPLPLPEIVPEPTPVPEIVPDPVPVSEPVPADDPQTEQMEIIRDENINQEVTEELPPFDNRLDLERFESPSLDLLKDYAEGQHKVSQQELDINNNRIRATLLNYRIEVVKVTAIVGPTVTLYKVFPAPGVKVSSIENVRREIAMALGVNGVRVVMLPDSVGIEVPNSTPSIVPLKSMLNSEAFRSSKAELPIAIGYTITQEGSQDF